MTEVTYDLSKTKEVPERFRTAEVKFNLPSTVEEIRALVHEEANFDEVLVGYFNGQGYRLGVQKRIKDLLASKDWEGLDAEEGIRKAVEQATTEKLGAPRQRAAGGTKGKVAKAEAAAEQARTSALEMYKAMPQALRKKFRQQLLDAGTLTAEQLDEADAA
jgi:hypothetical protein